MSLRLKLLLFLLALTGGAAAFVASHCQPPYEDCGHVVGAPCPGGGACVYLPDNPWFPGETLVCKGASSSGGGGDPTPTAVPTAVPTATPSSWETDGGAYSYDDECEESIDPVTMIIRFVGIAAAEHVAHHGQQPLDVAVGGEQHYIQYGNCYEGPVSQGSNNGSEPCFPQFACPQSRWHARCSEWLPDPEFGTWASCTPHWDQAQNQLCWHFVPAQFGDRWPGLNPEGSGFDAGRDYLYHILVVEGDHEFDGAQYWGNIHRRQQCNGDMSGSNGWVNFIF